MNKDKVHKTFANQIPQYLIDCCSQFTDHVQIENPFAHLHVDAPHTEHLYLVVHAGHEPEELLAVLVPLDGVELGALEVVVTAQTGARAQDQLTRHSQPLHAQGPAALGHNQVRNEILIKIRNLF